MLLFSLLIASSAEAGTRCGTPALLAQRNAGVELLMTRPDSVGSVESAIYPIRVHYRRYVDAERAELVVLPAAEHAWEVEIVQMGWPQPPPDGTLGGDEKYDFYLTNQGTFGGAFTYGAGPDVTPGDNWYSVPTHIALDEVITDADMGAFIAHELNHASQYTIDAWEWVLFPWESTAEAIMDIVEDANDTYMWEIPDFNQLPFASLLHDGYSDEVYAYDDWSYYEYGGSIFGSFVEERYGTKDGTELLAMWDAMAQPSQQQEPDFVDALATIDPSAPTAIDLYAEFAVWRMFMAALDDGAHFEEASLFPADSTVWEEDVLLLSEVDGAVLEPEIGPWALGTSYWAVDLEAGTDQLLRVDLDGDADSAWGIAWAVWQVDGSPAVTGFVTAAAGQPVSVDIPLLGGETARFGVVNGGPVGLEGEDVYSVPRATYTATLSLVAPPPEDTGTPTGTDPGTTDTPTTPDGSTPTDPTAGDGGTGDVATDDAKAGCGCATGPGASPSGLLILAAALLSRRRGRAQ